MKKQSQSASSERVKALVKFSATGILTLAMLASVTACNKPGQTTTPNKPNPPVVDPIEKTVTVNKIYADNFSGTSFDGDIQAAQTALANKVFENLNPQITNIKYNEDTKELEFSIAYTEDDKTKSGSMTFSAPQFFQTIRGRDAKSIVLERAELVGTTEIKEGDIDSTKSKISSTISAIRDEIANIFASIKTSDIEVEKEHAPLPTETISFDELIAEELGEYLGNTDELHSLSKALLNKVYVNRDLLDDFKIAIDNDVLTFYLHTYTPDATGLVSASYKGKASEFETFFNAAVKPSALIDEFFDKATQNNLEIEKNSPLENSIKDKCNEIEETIDIQKSNFSSKVRTNFAFKSHARHNNTLTDEQALQFALKLGYTADEVCGVYVGTPATHPSFDSDNYFTTGYLSFFNLSVLNIKDGEYKLDTQQIIVPHYTNSTQEDYYRYFLEGEEGKRYVKEKETTTSLNGIFIDYAEQNKTAQSRYEKMASIDEYDLYLPLNFN